MSIDVTCGKCAKPFAVKDKYAGLSVPCPDCQAPAAIPDPDACMGMEREFWRVILYPLLVLTVLAWAAAPKYDAPETRGSSSPATLWVAVVVIVGALAISSPPKTPPRDRR